MSATLLKLNLTENESDSMNDIWNEIVSNIKINEKNNWLVVIPDKINLLRISGNEAVLSVPSEFHKTMIESHKEILLEYMREKLDHIAKISFEIVEDEEAKEEETMLEKAQKSAVRRSQQPLSKPAAPKSVIIGDFYENYKFNSFVVCDTNKKAFDLCLITAEMPQNSPGKILAIYGKTGVGKTHLLQAIGHFAYQENTAKNIRYLNAINFVSAYVNWTREQKDLTEFYRQFDETDLFLIDDVHLFRGLGTQKAFFEILTLLYDKNKQIVITSDCTPDDIPDMLDSLKMRLNNSIAVEIQPPSKKNRLEIIKKKLCDGQIELSEDVLTYIADIPTTNIRELEGLYNRLLAASIFCNADLDIDSVKLILNDYVKHSGRITADIILDRVCSFFGIECQEIRSSSRTKTLAYPRSLAMYLIRSITGNSEQTIGNILGRDHSTVCITCKKIAENIKYDKKLQKDIDLLMEIITGQQKS